MTTYSLSAEEYILSLLLINETAAAIAVKEEAFPEASEQEMDVRLDSAVNGLLSKRLLNLQDENQELNENFRQYLSQLFKASRAVKFQVLDGDSLKIVSLYLGETMEVQVMEYNARTHTFFPISGLSELKDVIDFQDKDDDESFILPEPIFDQLIQQLLSKGNVPDDFAYTDRLPTEFLETLLDKGGRLNSMYDFVFDASRNVRSLESYLYVSRKDKTWVIEQNGNELIFRTRPLQKAINVITNE